PSAGCTSIGAGGAVWAPPVIIEVAKRTTRRAKNVLGFIFKDSQLLELIGGTPTAITRGGRQPLANAVPPLERQRCDSSVRSFAIVSVGVSALSIAVTDG